MPGRETIAVLGAGGIMGFPMARNLIGAGCDVRAWNRSRDKAEPLREDGAQVLDTPAEAARGADVILTMLTDADTVLDSVRDALAGGAGQATLWVQMSTIGERGTERCTKLAEERELAFLDAPVLGTKQPAQDGALVVLASGPSELKERAAPIFDAVGQRTIWVGEAGSGTRLKLVTNSWVLTIVEGCAETLAFAEGMGLDPQLVLDAVQGGALDLPYLQMKGKAILERAFEPSFRLALAAKDAGLMEQAIEARQLDLPLLRTIRARLDEGVAEHGEDDMIATYLTSAPNGAR